MIIWQDFVLDDVCGPLLQAIEDATEESIPVCRRTRLGSPSVMDDATGSQIQETGQGQRPARMVGQPNLDSNAALKTREGQVATPMPSAQVKGGKG